MRGLFFCRPSSGPLAAARGEAGTAGSAGWPSLLQDLSNDGLFSLLEAVAGRPPKQKISIFRAEGEQTHPSRGTSCEQLRTGTIGVPTQRESSLFPLAPRAAA